MVFFKQLEIKDPDAKDGKRRIPMLRYFHVFNVEQCDGLELEPMPVHDVPVMEAAEAVWLSYMDRGAPALSFGGGRAFYRPADDSIRLPDRGAFESAGSFYGTLWHECVHSTGHESRLARADLRDAHNFGDACYSREELTAEIGSAMIAATVGIDTDIEQSAAYVAGWLRALRGDKKLVVSAASRAQAAADWILGS